MKGLVAENDRNAGLPQNYPALPRSEASNPSSTTDLVRGSSNSPTPQIPANRGVVDSTTPQTSLERLADHILEHGMQFGSGTRLVVALPARNSCGSSIAGAFHRFCLDTFDGLVWVHSNTARTTYLLCELDAVLWLLRLEGSL